MHIETTKNMETIGKVFAVLAKQGGTSAATGKAWSLQSFVIETKGKYPTKQCFDLFGDERIERYLPNESELIKVYFELESRENNGRWFTSARAWKTEPYVEEVAESQGSSVAEPAPVIPTMSAPVDVNTNLPF